MSIYNYLSEWSSVVGVAHRFLLGAKVCMCMSNNSGDSSTGFLPFKARVTTTPILRRDEHSTEFVGLYCVPFAMKLCGVLCSSM